MKNEIVIEMPAPNEQQIQALIEGIMATKEKIESNKIVLKDFKIKSPELDDLKKKQKVLKEAMDAEKERIENVHLEDKDFEQAKNDDLTLRNQLKEKTAMLRVALRNKHKVNSLYTEDHVVNNEQMKLQLEFAAKVYINGKELK